MRKNTFKAKEHIKGLNNLRIQLLLPITDVEFRNKLRDLGIPGNSLFFSELRRAGIVKRTEENTFIFTNPDIPIHYLALQSVYDSYKNREKEYSKNYTEKRKARKKQNNERISEAVKLLKENGYEIYIPVGTLFQKL